MKKQKTKREKIVELTILMGYGYGQMDLGKKVIKAMAQEGYNNWTEDLGKKIEPFKNYLERMQKVYTTYSQKEINMIDRKYSAKVIDVLLDFHKRQLNLPLNNLTKDLEKLTTKMREELWKPYFKEAERQWKEKKKTCGCGCQTS
jgi:hypothetical protein